MPNQAKDDVYKKPAAQPAVVKYKVQKDDTYVSLGGQSVIAANPGVPQLSTGQVINLPNPNITPTSGYGGGVHSFYGSVGSMLGAQGQSNFAPTGSFLAGGGNTALSVHSNIGPNRPTGNSFISGSGQVNQGYYPTAQGSFVSGNGNVNMTGPRNGFQTPTTNGFMAPQLTSGSFYSGSGEVNLTGVTAGGGSGGNSGGAFPRPPEGSVYTGDPNDPNTAAWRNYWNYSAAHPQEIAAQNGYIPTYQQQARTQWQQNAERRRRQNDSGDYINYATPPQIVQQDFATFGNNVVVAPWRVG